MCALQITERRHQLKLTQRDVVDRLDALGIVATNRTLSAMEHGAGIDVGRLPELAVALECTVTYLLGLTSHPKHWDPDRGAMPALETGPASGACTDPACWLDYPGHGIGNGNGNGRIHAAHGPAAAAAESKTREPAAPLVRAQARRA
ncbi:MAG: helix-turn-helix domain-containing protein [Sporichthyaceae bacterium]